MRRYSTPTVEVTVEGHDLTGMDEVAVTFRQGPRLVIVKDPPMTTETHDGITDTIIAIPLTQVQTASFTTGDADVQVNYMDTLGHRVATTIGTITVEKNILERLMPLD